MYTHCWYKQLVEAPNSGDTTSLSCIVLSKTFREIQLCPPTVSTYVLQCSRVLAISLFDLG
jgi:hypothetical protein